MHLDAPRLLLYSLAALIEVGGVVRMAFLLRAAGGSGSKGGRIAATIAIVAFSIALVCTVGLLIAGLTT